jgi:Holliday junction resolvasome RuvABC endonuclease subunit
MNGKSIILALDPSFTATGWVAIDLASGLVVGGGVIRTKPPEASDRSTAAEANGRRGLHIRRGIVAALREHHPAIVVQEGNAGSQSAKAAAALARAQQACLDAIDAELGALPIIVTPQSVKKHAVGRLDASKDDLERFARSRWGESLERMIAGCGTRGKVLENVYDAACVASSVWDMPAVAGLRRMAGAA